MPGIYRLLSAYLGFYATMRLSLSVIPERPCVYLNIFMKLMLKVLALFIPAIALLFYFLGGPADPAGTAAPAAETLVKLASLPSEVSESSGIVFLAKDKTYVTHNDAGNKPYLYILNEKGKLLHFSSCLSRCF
jgi:hypothetical protein